MAEPSSNRSSIFYTTRETRFTIPDISVPDGEDDISSLSGSRASQFSGLTQNNFARRNNFYSERRGSQNQLCRNCLTSGSICVNLTWPYDQELHNFINSNSYRQKHPLTTTFFNFIGKHADNFSEFIQNDEDAEKLVQFINKIEKAYQDVPYHSKMHAVDVLTGSEVLMNQIEDAGICKFTNFERFTMLLAAACHDVGHPSVNSHYVFHDESLEHLNNDKSHVLIKELKNYGETGLLEQAHSQIAIHYMQDIDFDLFQNPEFLKLFKFLILATDMSQHNKKVDKLTEIITQVKQLREENVSVLEYFQNETAESIEQRHEILAITLHLADLSNPAKNFEDSVDWAGKVCTEFFQQGDIENFKTGKISNKIFNRKETSLEDSQIGFINWVVMPLVNQWCDLLQEMSTSKNLKNLLLQNKEKYVERKENAAAKQT